MSFPAHATSVFALNLAHAAIRMKIGVLSLSAGSSDFFFQPESQSLSICDGKQYI